MEDEAILRVSAAGYVALWWRFFPLHVWGALILTGRRLTFESAHSDVPFVPSIAEGLDVPVQSITDATVRSWPSALRMAPLLTFFVLWPAVRRMYQANLLVECESTTHHFHVRDPEGWVQALSGVKGSR